MKTTKLFVVAEIVNNSSAIRSAIHGVFSREEDAIRYCARYKPNKKQIFERRLDDLVLQLLDDKKESDIER